MPQPMSSRRSFFPVCQRAEAVQQRGFVSGVPRAGLGLVLAVGLANGACSETNAPRSDETTPLDSAPLDSATPGSAATLPTNVETLPPAGTPGGSSSGAASPSAQSADSEPPAAANSTAVDGTDGASTPTGDVEATDQSVSSPQSTQPSAASSGDGADGASSSNGTSPELVPTDPCAVKAVDAGNVHTCALDYAGAVWCWGNNSYAAVGSGAANGAQRTPYRLDAVGTDNRDIITGQDTSCAVKHDGHLVCWGSFGDADGWDHVRAATAFDVFGTDWRQLSLHTAACAVTANSKVACWGFGSNQATEIAGFGEDVTQVSISHDTVCAVKADGSLMCGRIGGAAPKLVSGVTGVTQVSVGGALDADSDPWGRLLATASDGFAYWAAGGGTATKLSLAGADVVETYIGETTASEHMYAAGTRSGIATWGTNRCGALGDGLGGGGDTSHDHRDVTKAPALVSGIDSYVKLAVGHEHACAIRGDGSLWCWGRNAEGQIGSGAGDTVCDSGDASPNQSAPIQIKLCAE